MKGIFRFVSLFLCLSFFVSANSGQKKISQKKSGKLVEVRKNKDLKLRKEILGILREIRENPDLLKAGGEEEHIKSEQGSVRVSNAETAAQESKEWDAISKSSYNVKKGFIKFPGTNNYLRLYGFGQLVAVATNHQNAAGYTADYSLFPVKVAPNNDLRAKRTAWDYNMLVNESRIGLEIYSTAKFGDTVHPLKVQIECDFSGGENGTQTLSKKYQLNLRHAYFSAGNFIFGQTTTIFADPDASAETMNGPTGATSKRLIQMQYVWQLNPALFWKFSLERHFDADVIDENGENVVKDYDIANPRSWRSSGAFPSFVTSITKNFGKGHISGALAVRNLKISKIDNPRSKGLVGVIGRVSGSYNLYKEDDVFGVVTYGSAPGKYISDLDGTVFLGTDEKLKALKALGIEFGLRHFWTQVYKIRSTLALGYVRVYNKDEARRAPAPAVVKEIVKSLFSVTANVMMSMYPNFDMGLEYSYGAKKLEDNRKGQNHAIMFISRIEF